MSKDKVIVSLFKGCLKCSEPLGFSTIGEILKEIRNDNDKEGRAFASSLVDALWSDPKKYQAIKEAQCKAYIIGQFSERKNEACQKYEPLIGFDIDAFESEAKAKQCIQKLAANPYVYAAYLSPSNEGIRFLVWCDSTQETHKKYYQTICQYFSKVLKIPTDKALRKQLKGEGMATPEIKAEIKKRVHIDTGTNNLARLWFYTWVDAESFHHNEQSQTFYIKPKAQAVASNGHTASITEDRKIKICLDKVGRQDLPEGRNNFVFAFACELARHGVNKARALSECLAYQESDFSPEEIEKSINSAYQSKKVEFTDKQILAYEKMIYSEKKRSPYQERKESKKPESEKTGRKLNKFMQIKNYIGGNYDLRFNLVSNEIEISPKEKDQYKVFNENNIFCELYERGFNGIQNQVIALVKSDFVPEYDPFKEYFESLPEWKQGDPDHITQLANFIEAKDQFWFNTQFKKMLVRSVACALKIIAFNKQCFVLKGGQNDGKSSFVRFLCPPRLKEYITQHINPNNKDGDIALCRNFIINLDELDKFSKQEVSKVKAMITVDNVKERLPFGRNPVSIPRRCSFFGSTNVSEFLTDVTGNVRWLVVEIKKNGIKHDNGGKNGYTAIDMDLVYSQAYALLKSGFEFEMTKEEINKSEKNNQGFQVATVEQELIIDRFAPASEETEGAKFMTATEILKTIEIDTKTTLTRRKVGQALKLLNFDQAQKFFKNHGYQKKGYWVKEIKDNSISY
jgi:predicted P-loop ATPase